MSNETIMGKVKRFFADDTTKPMSPEQLDAAHDRAAKALNTTRDQYDLSHSVHVDGERDLPYERFQKAQAERTASAAAFRRASTPEERTSALDAHPQLKRAFALEAQAVAFSRDLPNEKAQTAFMHRIRDHIADAIERDGPLANVRFKQPDQVRAERREPSVEHSR